MTLQEQIELYLKDLPSKWRDQLVTLLCQIKAEKSQPSCEEVKDCETVTTLSDFTIDGTTVSITYTNEDSVEVTRSFDFNQLINNELEDLDPGCLASPTEWSNMTYPEKIQTIINAHCNCCGETILIEYDSTGSDECASPFTDPIIFTLIGQSGQGVFSFVVTQNTNSIFPIPANLTGTFAIFILANGTEYFTADLKDSSNVSLLSPIATTDGSGTYGTPGNPSDTFDIEDLDHIIFACTNS